MRFAASTRKLAPIYAQNNTRTLDDNSHAAIPMRSATGDSKTPYNYAHTSRAKAASSHHDTAARKTGKPTAAATAGQTRYLSSPAAATLHGKTQGFVLRLPPPNRAFVVIGCFGICGCRSHWNGCMMLQGLCFREEAGGRNLVFFRVKWLQPAMKGTSSVRLLRLRSVCFFFAAL